MSDAKLGTVGWVDLTVPNADEIRDFYAGVVGWKPEALSMGDYSDYVMTMPADGTGVAGVGAVAALVSPPKEPSGETKG